jgi:hypothetical protein
MTNSQNGVIVGQDMLKQMNILFMIYGKTLPIGFRRSCKEKLKLKGQMDR